MLNAIFSQKLNTQSKTVNNAVITLGDTDDTGKGRKFKSRFIQPGIAGYPGQFGNVLIRKETLDKFINTLVGSPVIINHKNLTVKNADENRVGVVSSVWYDNKDGWYWCDGVIWDKTAQNLIADKGWSVSCSYDVTLADDAGGTENNIKYDMEFLNGVFTHLAIVNNPRYERANIVLNSKNVNADDIDYWFSTKTGAHIPVLKGQTKEEALQEFVGKGGGGNKLNEQKQVGTHFQSGAVPKYINQEVTVYATPRHYEGGHTSPKINKILDYIYEGNNLQSTIDKMKSDEYPEERITDIYNDFKNGVYKRIEGTPRHTKIKKILNPEWRPQYDGTAETTDDILDDYERRTSTDTVGHGYSNYSMSKNAVSAYNKGSMPISKWTKKNIIDEINKLVEAYSIPVDVEKYSKMSIEDLKKNYLKEAGYHHTSKYYNATYFYKIDLEEILQDTLKNQSVSSYNSTDNYNYEQKRKKEMEVLDKIKELVLSVDNNCEVDNDRWITIHPHGKDNEDYRHIKLEDGETPREAIDRIYKKSKKPEKSEKEEPNIESLIKEEDIVVGNRFVSNTNATVIEISGVKRTKDNKLLVEYIYPDIPSREGEKYELPFVMFKFADIKPEDTVEISDEAKSWAKTIRDNYVEQPIPPSQLKNAVRKFERKYKVPFYLAVQQADNWEPLKSPKQLAFDFTRKIQNSLEAIIDSYAAGEIEKSKYDLKLLKGLRNILENHNLICNNNNNDDIDYWFTTKTGTHIPVLKGQSKEEALNEFANKKNNTQSVDEAKASKAFKNSKLAKVDVKYREALKQILHKVKDDNQEALAIFSLDEDGDNSAMILELSDIEDDYEFEKAYEELRKENIDKLKDQLEEAINKFDTSATEKYKSKENYLDNYEPKEVHILPDGNEYLYYETGNYKFHRPLSESDKYSNLPTRELDNFQALNFDKLNQDEVKDELKSTLADFNLLKNLSPSVLDEYYDERKEYFDRHKEYFKERDEISL